MNYDSFSDLVLCAICFAIAYRSLSCWPQRSGIAIAMILIGIAAGIGVLRFSSWDSISDFWTRPHQFASTLAAVGGFPILEFSIVYPKSPLAVRPSGAWWLCFVVSGFGMGVWMLGFRAWSQIAPLLSWLCITATVIYARRWQETFGAILILCGFLSTLVIQDDFRWFGVFSKVQILHYLLAMGLFVLCGSKVNALDTG